MHCIILNGLIKIYDGAYYKLNVVTNNNSLTGRKISKIYFIRRINSI